MDVRFYLSLFLKRLHWFLLIAVLGTAAGITLARLLPPVYVARAKLVVESEQIPGSLAASTVEVQAFEQLQIIRQRILTRDTLIEMANRLQIYAPRAGEPLRRLEGDEIVEDLRERIAITTSGGTVTRGPAQATLVDVSFDAPTAQLASAVANDVVTLILKADVEMRTGTARQTLDFFEREVARIDRELAAQGDRMLRFKEANKDALPDSLDFRRSQQSAAAERQLDLQRQEAELRDRRDRMIQLRDSNGFAPQTGPQTPEGRQLAQTRDELATQAMVLSDEHPRIKMLKARVEQLEKVVAQQSGAGALDAQGRELSAFDMQLATLDSQLSYIAQQRERLTAQMEAMQTAIDATPGNAITLGTLERDYANLRGQYDQAVANKSRAETGDMIEAMAKGQRISVIEQAVPPREPERPNRMLIAVAGMAGGLAGGAGLVVLLIMLSPAIRRPEDLTRKLGITAFAVLPFLDTAEDRRRRHIRRLVILVASLAAIGLLLLAVDRFYMPLDLLVMRFTGLMPADLPSLPRLV